jgi:hypothetical protein
MRRKKATLTFAFYGKLDVWLPSTVHGLTPSRSRPIPVFRLLAAFITLTTIYSIDTGTM